MTDRLASSHEHGELARHSRENEIPVKNRGIMRAVILFGLGSSLAIAAACSSSSNEASTCFCDGQGDAAYNPDSDNPYFVDAGGPPSTYAAVRLENDLCLPNALPTDDAGFVDCHVVVFFPAPAACGFGFGNARSSDSTYLVDYSAANGVPLPNGAFCELLQSQEDSCLADSGVNVAWCYVHGGCEADSGCAQSLCTSSDYDSGAGTYAWLVCP
jgi:hypothetical protein